MKKTFLTILILAVLGAWLTAYADNTAKSIVDGTIIDKSTLSLSHEVGESAKTSETPISDIVSPSAALTVDGNGNSKLPLVHRQNIPYDPPTISTEYLNEGFEGAFLPAGWTQVVTNVNGLTWDQSDYNPYTGTYSAACLWDTVAALYQDEWLITPTLDFTSATTQLRMGFWWASGYTYNVVYDAADITILGSIDGGQTWSQPLWSEDDMGLFNDYEYNYSQLWLTDYVGESNVQFAFRYEGTDGDRHDFDDILITDDVAEVGACCLEQDCIATTTLFECVTTYGGRWFAGQDCGTFTCPENAMICPDGTIFAQEPNGSNAANADIDGGYQIYEYVRVNGEVTDLHWWGVKGYFDGAGWLECFEDPVDFEVVIYPDDGTGMPDVSAPICTFNPSIAGFDTGELFAGWPIYRYDLTISPACNVSLGAWISIQGNPGGDPACWFLWHTSNDGDISAWQYDMAGDSWADAGYDMSICVTGTSTPLTGACCDMYNATCDDGIELAECPVGNRFEAATLCADLNPPCEAPLGACCVNVTCVATNAEVDCDMLGGIWYEGEDCNDFSCGSCPDAIYQNGGPGTQGSLPSTQCDPYYPMASGLADDFVLPGTDPITILTVTAWTGHWNATPVATPADYEGVMVTIYADQPDSTPNEPGGKPISGDTDCNHTELMPGGVIYSVNVTSFGFVDDAVDVWRLTIPVNVTLTGGVTYWLEVAPILDFASYGQSGWVLTDAQTGQGVTQIFELLGTNEWTTQDPIADAAFCLSDQEPSITGACCDDDAGTCIDDLPAENCPGGYRFMPNTLCADLYPLCGEDLLGACCVDEVCVATNTEDECTTLGGTWYLEQDCVDFNCPMDLVCPEDNVLFGQLPDGSTAAVSEEGQFLTVFENFGGVNDPIQDVHWWGVTAYNDGTWNSCDEAPIEFTIQFYNDDGTGLPDIASPVCTYTMPVTGIDTYNTFAGWPIYQYDVVLPTDCNLTEGWVSIQGAGDPNCWFLWHNCLSGDGMSWQYDESADPDSMWDQAEYDMSICLTGEGSGGCFEYLPGDVNMFNGAWPPMVIGGDVTFLVNYFRGMPSSNPCPLDGFWASADANGDCMVIGSDVTKLVNYFRGMGNPSNCPDNPPCWPTSDDLPPSAPAGWPNCD
ncbi:MAG: hypothetical protein GY839_14815 [candidate division Zixibacteria bacterium]|nr:hypothetical protein [candidate division Zixibacteria bacterium]